jgi:hypothetical protein
MDVTAQGLLAVVVASGWVPGDRPLARGPSQTSRARRRLGSVSLAVGADMKRVGHALR